MTARAVPLAIPAAASGGYRRYALALLMLIYALNFVDRRIVTIPAPYLKANLGLTDVQIGLVLLIWCARVLPAGEASVLARARAAGDAI